MSNMAVHSVNDRPTASGQGIGPATPVMPTAVMGTNDNCTVSKRSVEMLYYPKPHFYRYFVKKPKKRTALINRGYLLRMKAIEHRLKRFLINHKGNKVVINLGCGYDALPFRAMSEYAELTQSTTFVDVDYEKLIQEKIHIIQHNEELYSLLKGLTKESQRPHIHLCSENYVAIGCDLADSRPLQGFLTANFPTDTSFFVISEVAITYMPVETADAILSSFSHLNHAQFCILEQCLPNGPNHPFASTMLKHFDKLSSPLRVIQRYQTIQDQENRFHAHGWTNVDAQSLWDVWSSEEVFSLQDRIALRSKEMFDEHEEFGLFASHYFILTATSQGPGSVLGKPIPSRYLPTTTSSNSRVELRLRPRKDAALYEAREGVFVHHGGDDGRSRLADSQVYSNSSTKEMMKDMDEHGISARKYHTITKLNANNDCLLVGGRDSPERPFRDCWLLKNMVWNRVEDLPVPLFRHAATLYIFQDNRGENQSGVIIFGGKTSQADDSNSWYLWREGRGWTELQVDSMRISPRFSANLVYNHEIHVGVLLGGMLSSEIVSKEAFVWDVKDDKITIRPLELTEDSERANACRAGAVLVRHKDSIIIIGGISEHGLPRASGAAEGDIVKLRFQIDSNGQLSGLQQRRSNRDFLAIPDDIPQPMLIGHSAIIADDNLSIVGGGAICFSFGSFMNNTSWHVSLQESSKAQWSTGVWRTSLLPNMNNSTPDKPRSIKDEFQETTEDQNRSSSQTSTDGFIAINRILPGTRETLLKRIAKGKPCVFESVYLGECVQKWTSDYLKQAMDSDRIFDIHHASTKTMLFESKNFVIRKQNFMDFIDAVVARQKVYLRAVSLKDKHKPASFYQDFETLAPDFKIPEHLAVAEDQQHSSVLRISGPINMWLHYDTLSNILCQIRGSKRLILFSPADVAHLKIPPGRSSSDLDVFDPKAWQTTSLRYTHPYEAVLKPGDVLYIPPLWCHAALPLDGMSVAVNTFFKTEDDQKYAEGQDTYGNKDVSEYDHARKDVLKLISRFKTMPRDTRRFYLERLADEILQQARKKS